jgi:3-deoxy-D-manno-octulosonic-acid transferase
MLPWIAYNLILLAASPLLLLWALVRLGKGKSRRGWGQRLGLLHGVILQARRNAAGRDRKAYPRIWVHACSVGEVNAVRPVIKRLREALPYSLIVLSTITPTGQEQARRFCAEVDGFFYFPFDLLPCTWSALRIIQPDLCVLTEKELWPNFLAFCQAKKIPVVVVNGALSDHTAKRARWSGPFLRWLVRLVSFFSVQSEVDKTHLLTLGVNPDKILADGNTKLDQPPAPSAEAEDLARLLGWSEQEDWLVAASTHAGEEEIVAEAFALLRKKYPAARLILAPRHPERAPAAAAVLQKQGLPWICRSELVRLREKHSKLADAPVIILDTIGELVLTYRLARGVFVGGSFSAKIGGHSTLEVLVEGRPICFGPQMRNSRDIANLLLREGLAVSVHNASELAFTWQKAIEDRSSRETFSQRAQAVLESNKGASERAAQRVLAQWQEAKVAGENPPPSPAPALPEFSGGGQSKSKTYLLQVIKGESTGAGATLTRAGLQVLSRIYGWVLGVNLALYDWRLLKKAHLPCPVISIGNLTLGGTGKTLATQAICQWLIARRIKPAILSRGYGGKGGSGRLVYDGERLLLGPKEAGDEPFLLAASLPEARVLVGKDRRRSAQLALELGTQVILLDDGLQYWKIEKDCEIILVDALDPFSNGQLFPRGLLRETPEALGRAHAIWITHADMVSAEEREKLRNTLLAYAPLTPIFYTAHKAVCLRDFFSGERLGLWTLSGKKVLAFSGIGNPISFEQLLQKLGGEVTPVRFPDHHAYQEHDLQAMLEAMPGNITQIITTAKDAVRLPRQLPIKLPLRVLEVALVGYGETGEQSLSDVLEATLYWLTPGK